MGLLKLTPVHELVGDQGHMRVAVSEAGKRRKKNMGGVVNERHLFWETVEHPRPTLRGQGSRVFVHQLLTLGHLACLDLRLSHTRDRTMGI